MMIQSQKPIKNLFVHLFEMKGAYYLLDVPTSALLRLDKAAYHLIKSISDNSLRSLPAKSPENNIAPEIEAAISEYQILKKHGLFSNFRPIQRELTVEQFSNYKPHHFVLIVSQKCNLQCKYCYAQGGNFGGKESFMPQEVADEAVSFLIRNSNKQECGLTFFGGEPLLNFDLISRTVQYAKKKSAEQGKRFRFSITTNGTLLTDKIIAFLKKESFEVLISIDGPKNVHDAWRVFPNGKGSFDAVQKGTLKLIEDPGFHFSARATLTHNCISLRKLSDFFDEERFSRAMACPVSPKRAGGERDDYCLSPRDFKKLLDEYERLAFSIIHKYQKGKPVVLNPFKEYMKLLQGRVRRRFSCGVGRGMLTISAQGDIYPCQRFVGVENFVIGNLDHGIDSQRVFDIFCNFEATRRSCNSCWATFLCAKGCMNDWANTDGSFVEHRDEGCELIKKIIELSIFIFATIKDDSFKHKSDFQHQT